MNRSLALVFGASLSLTAAAAGYYLTWPGSGAGITPGSSADEVVDRDREMDAELNAVLPSEAAKHALAWDVIAGRLPLRQAAARFRAISAANPWFHEDAFRVSYPTGSDEERWGRCVIQFVRVELAERPAEADATTARLEAELREDLDSRE